MNQNHAAFFSTNEGNQFALILRRSVHKYGYALVSGVEEPAIGAAAWEIDPLLHKMQKKRRDFVKQACGALVGDLMTEMGAVRAKTRSGRPRSARVKASRVFTMGAVWRVPESALKRLAEPLP